MNNRDFLLKAICDENFRTKLKRTMTNDRSAPLIKVEGEILKNFRAVEETGLRSEMDQQCGVIGPPPPPPPPPSFSLTEIKLPKSDDGTLIKVKKRAAIEIGGQPDRNALMEQIKDGKFKLKKVGNLHKEEEPQEIADELQKILPAQPAIDEYQSQKSTGNFDRAPNNVENTEKIGKIKISPLFQTKNESRLSIATTVDEKPKSPTKSMQVVAQMTKMLENSTVKEPSPPIKNGRFFADVVVQESNPENGAKFSPVDQELARSTIMNVLSKKMTSSQDFIIYQKSKFLADENSENSKTLRSADSVESLSSGSISLNSEFAESVDSKISSSNGSTSSTSKISALRMNFQQNGGCGGPTFVVHGNFGDSNFSSAKITPKNDNSNKATSKFGATLSRMKSLEVLPTNNGGQKLKICNNIINDERQEKSLSPSNRKIYDQNPIPFPKLGTLRSRFEYSSTSTLPGLSPTKSLGRAPISLQNYQFSNQNYSTKTLSNLFRQSSKCSNNEENLYTATPIFVNLSKKSPFSLAKNVSPDSGHSSPKNGRPTATADVETWRVKKDSLENNLFTGSDPLANDQRLGVSKTLENLYQSKKKRTMDIVGVENVEIPRHQNGRPKDGGDEISAVLQKPLNELMQYQFQIDLFQNGTNDLIRLEKRVPN